MCGIIGAAGAITISEENMVKKMLQLDTIRGPHSTGLFGLETDGEEHILKKTGTPFELALYRNWTQFWTRRYNVLIGHNRYATVGSINDATAHPFNYGSVSGVHNGTLKNGWKSKLDNGYTFDVDSECIYNHIANNGIEDTVKKLDGAFTLVYYDNANGTINMTRNKERPLYFCHSIDMKTIFWASEDWMLEVAAEKANVKIGEISLLRENILYSIEITQGLPLTCPVLGGEVTDLEQYVNKWVAPKKHKPSHTGKTTGTGHTNKHTNIISLKDKTRNEALTGLMGKHVSFTVDGLDKDSKCGMEYVDGTPVGEYPVQEVRYYFQAAGESDVVAMLDSGRTYKGIVRAVRNVPTSAYVTIDPRTLELVPEETIPEVKH